MSEEKITNAERLAAIETDIKHLTKSIDKLINKLPDFSAMEQRIIVVEQKINSIELQKTRLNLMFLGALISAIFGVIAGIK
jgi:hypothetical protein